jgi:hypothetical protein
MFSDEFVRTQAGRARTLCWAAELADEVSWPLQSRFALPVAVSKLAMPPVAAPAITTAAS